MNFKELFIFLNNYKAYGCGRSLSRIAVSNSAEGMDVYLL